MPTYKPVDINTKPVQSGDGEAVIYDGKVVPGVATATGDIIRFMRVPAGTRLCDIAIRVVTAFGATAPCTLQLQPVDGTAATVLVAAGDTVLATVNRKPMVFEPMTVAKDSFLECLVGTVVTGAAGVATCTAHGMSLGAK